MFEKLTLKNGVRLVYEKIPHIHSVAVGIWVGTGSRWETVENNGVSHILEHMLFKGTSKRTAKQIAESIDDIGGQINAFTGKECTCYYTKTLDTHLDIAMDVLSDMFFNSNLSVNDLDVEKKVIIEEISMYEDTPEELVHDILCETIWKKDSLGYTILGTAESVKAASPDTLRDYMKKYYVPSNVVISVAGNFDEKNLEDMVRNLFENWKGPKVDVSELGIAEFHTDHAMRWKDIEQVHLCLGMEGIEHGNEDLYTLLAINNLFGGGMSSRLFQKIREEKGLVYSIYSYPSSYKSAGMFTICAGMNAEFLETVIDLSLAEIRTLKEHGLTKDEISRAKEQLKGNYILGLESTSSRMNSIGKSELLLGKMYSPSEVLKKIEQIDQERVNDVINRVFNVDKMSAAVVGNIKEDDEPFKLLK